MIKKLINKKSNGFNGVFYLSDLKIIKNIQSEQFYFELNGAYKEKLFQEALSISENIRNLARETNINYFNLWDCIRRTPISLTNLRKISNFLVQNGFKKYSLNNVSKHIDFMKGGFTNEKIYHPKFPIRLNTKYGMRFISHIYHDGSIGTTNRQPHYRNKSLRECNEFLKDAKTLFGEFDRKIKKNKDGTYSVHLPTVIGDLMISFGYIKGDKTKQNNETFEFLNNIHDKDLLSVFLEKAFNDDGCVGKRCVSLEQSSLILKGCKKPSKILLLDKLFLERLGLKVFGPKLSGIYKNRHGECVKYYIAIYSKEQLRAFNELIKLIPYKKEKLEKYLNISYKIKKA